MPALHTCLKQTLCFILLTGCGSLGFNVDQDLPEETVQGNPLGGILPSLVPSPFPLTIDVKSETEKRSTGPASAAFLKSLRFTATPHAMPSGNFDFVDEIHLFVDGPANSTLPQKEIASLKPVPKGATTLDLVIAPNVDLLPYLNQGATISATAQGRQPSSTFTFDGHVVVTIRI
jgi:hypothetical protein